MAASASGIDEQTQMVQFVKIIQRYPDIYDHNMETYRRWTADKAWEKVVETVKNEMELDCSLEELKSKWKGIRSSYNRFKKKIIEEKKKGALFSKKYYLYDSLQFLEPFTKSKGFKRNTSDIPENVFENCDNIDDEQESVSEPDPKWQVKIKSDPTENNDENNEANSYSDDDQTVDQKKYKKFKKRKREDKDTSNDSQDMQFFKSILPDIAGFTTKEKRKLKIGILKLVDDIENERRKRKRKSGSDSSSSSE